MNSYPSSWRKTSRNWSKPRKRENCLCLFATPDYLALDCSVSDPVTETPLRQKTIEESDDNIEESDNNIEESDKDTESLDGSESKVSSVDILEAITDSLDCSESEVSYQCEFCEDHFSYRQDLTKHIARIHEENGESNAPRKKAKASLDCSKSEVSSVRKNKLDKELHLVLTPVRQENIELSDHNIEEPDKDTDSLDGRESKLSSVVDPEADTTSLESSESEVSYQCEFCENHFSYRKDLSKHIARIHEENGESNAPRKKAKASLDCSKSKVSSGKKNKLDKELRLVLTPMRQEKLDKELRQENIEGSDDDFEEPGSETKVNLWKETEDYKEFSLPYGWKKEGHRRKGSTSTKLWDFYVFSPEGRKFRSTNEINKYLDNNPEIKCDRNVTNTHFSNISPISKKLPKGPSKPNKTKKSFEENKSSEKMIVSNSKKSPPSPEDSPKKHVTARSIEHSLPYGWKKVGYLRGKTIAQEDGAIKWDYFFVFTPDGKRLRSNVEIDRYLDANPEVKCDRNITNTKFINLPKRVANELCVSEEENDVETTKIYCNTSSKKSKSNNKRALGDPKQKSAKKHLNEDTEKSLDGTERSPTKDKLEYSLPYGWKKVGNKRKSGRDCDNWDFYVICPSGKRFRSNVEINRYLDANPDIKCDRNVTNTNRSAEGEPMRKSMKLFDSKVIDSSEAEETSDAGNDYIFKCQKCPKVLNSALDLKSHFEKMHDDTSRRFSNRKFDEKLGNFEDLPEASLYRCLNCPYRTNVPEEMISHHIDNH